jgi:hypothetical protein
VLQRSEAWRERVPRRRKRMACFISEKMNAEAGESKAKNDGRRADYFPAAFGHEGGLKIGLATDPR